MLKVAQLLLVAALLGFLYWHRDRRVAAQLQLGRILGRVTDTGQLAGRLRGRVGTSLDGLPLRGTTDVSQWRWTGSRGWVSFALPG